MEQIWRQDHPERQLLSRKLSINFYKYWWCLISSHSWCDLNYGSCIMNKPCRAPYTECNNCRPPLGGAVWHKMVTKSVISFLPCHFYFVSRCCVCRCAFISHLFGGKLVFFNQFILMMWLIQAIEHFSCFHLWPLHWFMGKSSPDESFGGQSSVT